MYSEMFDESQKWSGYAKKSCKSQYAHQICIVGFIKKYINIFKLTLQCFLWEFNLKSQMKKKILRKLSLIWNAMHYEMV